MGSEESKNELIPQYGAIQDLLPFFNIESALLGPGDHRASIFYGLTL
jgi:hypothetical protein